MSLLILFQKNIAKVYTYYEINQTKIKDYEGFFLLLNKFLTTLISIITVLQIDFMY